MLKLRGSNRSLHFRMLVSGACLSLGIGAFTQTPASACPSAVVIMRHAEKDSGTSLSERGWQRAKALPGFFAGNPALQALGTPVAIYAAAPRHATSSTRPQETVTPLASALGLPIELGFHRDEVRSLAGRILESPAYDGRVVVVCWVHRTISDLPSAFGLRAPVDNWPNDQFNRIWILQFDSSCSPRLATIDEKLLPGDQ